MYTRSNGYVDLSPRLIENMGGKSRIRGRYSPSELYFINSGSTTPSDWINPPKREVFELLRMWKGIMAHEMVQGLLSKECCEIKKVITLPSGLTLAGKADYLPAEYPNEVWEFKSSDKLMDASKPWHDYQARLYCTMFEKDRGVVMQPVENKKGIYLKEVGFVNRDDAWFNREMDKLYEFHLKVEELWKQK